MCSFGSTLLSGTTRSRIPCETAEARDGGVVPVVWGWSADGADSGVRGKVTAADGGGTLENLISSSCASVCEKLCSSVRWQAGVEY